jgi:hypothetical protein
MQPDTEHVFSNQRARYNGYMHDEPEYTPTLEQIREECRRIQSEWSEADRRRRIGYKDFEPVFVKRRVRSHVDRRAL